MMGPHVLFLSPPFGDIAVSRSLYQNATLVWLGCKGVQCCHPFSWICRAWIRGCSSFNVWTSVHSAGLECKCILDLVSSLCISRQGIPRAATFPTMSRMTQEMLYTYAYTKHNVHIGVGSLILQIDSAKAVLVAVTGMCIAVHASCMYLCGRVSIYRQVHSHCCCNTSKVCPSKQRGRASEDTLQWLA